MSDLLTTVAEGLHNIHGSVRAAQNAWNTQVNIRPIFRRFAVIEVLFVPQIIDFDFEKNLVDKYGDISNIDLTRGRLLPRNTILAKEILNTSRANGVESSKTMLLFPFFASHISLPCKPGEHVWVMFEDLVKPGDIGYWVSRIVGFDHVDDVNHSHSPREYDEHFNILTDDKDKKIPRFHFKNGVFLYQVNYNNEEKYDPQFILTSPFLQNIKGQNVETIYENLILNSSSSKSIVKEAVPRFRKRPGDLALEGSNNSLIVLGTDRPTLTGSVSSAVLDSNWKYSAGTIDMVVGRGSTPESLGEIVKNELGFSEINKFGYKIAQSEGDLDYNSDRSRILISQKTSPDNKFSINEYNKSTFKVEDSLEGDAAIVIRSDKVRIIARSDIQFLVQNFVTGTNPQGENIKNSLNDTANWSSITIKANGDIIFTPSATGYIKLGGEDANRGILCTAIPVTPVNGGIEGQSIRNSSGGEFGGARNPSPTGNLPAKDPALGTFSNKVLIK